MNELLIIKITFKYFVFLALLEQIHLFDTKFMLLLVPKMSFENTKILTNIFYDDHG